MKRIFLRKIKQIFIFMLAIICIVVLLPIGSLSNLTPECFLWTVEAANDSDSSVEADSDVVSDDIANINQMELEQGIVPDTFSNKWTSLSPAIYGTRATTFWGDLPDGGHQLVVYHDKLYINNYNADYDLISSKELELELPLWGGLLMDKEYNYLVCGQSYDSSAENGGEVYRIIKYTKAFDKISSVSFNSDETYTAVPFDSGNVSMAISKEHLNVFTSRLRLDGHQSNISLRVSADSMEVENSSGMVSSPDMHASHSFRQIVRYDDEMPIYVDLSDGYPDRGICLQFGNTDITLMEVAGSVGDNVTSADLGGLAVTDNTCLVVGQKEKNDSQNIFLTCYDKNTQEVNGQWLTGSTTFDRTYLVGKPRLVSISENRFVVLWEKRSGLSKILEYVVINENGECVSKLKKQTGMGLSDCEPIWNGHSVEWIAIENGVISRCQIQNFDEDGNYEAHISMEMNAIDPWEGGEDISWYDDGEKEFEISTADQLSGLASLVNQGKTMEGKKFVIKEDIFLNDSPGSTKYEWISIGKCNDRDDTEYYFQGTLEGNGHNIYNMYVSEDGYGGLFGRIGEKGIVSGINISQGLLNKGGAIAYCNEGEIIFCKNFSETGNFDEYAVGGICNYNYGFVYGSQNNGEVWGSAVGGIVGLNYESSTVSECSNHGYVSSSADTAGLVYYNHGWIYHCYNIGSVSDNVRTLNYARSLSGLVTENGSYGKTANCYVACNFDITEAYVNNAIAWDSQTGNYIDCFYVSAGVESDLAQKVTLEEICSKDFIKKLDNGRYNVSSSWVYDEEGDNYGFPLNRANVNEKQGRYRIVPELWMLYRERGDESVKAKLSEGKKEITYQCYYCDNIPQITFSDTETGTVSFEGDHTGGTITVDLKKSGTGIISLDFPESEKNCESHYEISLLVEDDVPETPETNEYIITSSAGNGGSISPLGKTFVKEGEKQNYIIVPDEGYEISDVLVDGKSIGITGNYTFSNMLADHTIEARFQKKATDIDISDDDIESDSDKIKISSMNLSGISHNISVGKKITLKAAVTPANAANKKLTWSSSNKKVATVSQSGVVTIKKKTGGKSVTITAKATDGSGIKASWKIKVMKGVVKKVAISGKKTVKAGKSLKLKAKVTATKGANKKVKWTSSNTKYATVSASGKVKTYKAGKGKKVKITAMATDGSSKKKSVTIKIK